MYHDVNFQKLTLYFCHFFNEINIGLGYAGRNCGLLSSTEDL